MPRIARFEYPGAMVHIMSRGLDGMKIFQDSMDRAFFLSHLRDGLKRTGYMCYAWTLMDTHYHLFLRTSELPMSFLMRSLNGSYGKYYNKKYHRRGYLFQDRFKSILCYEQDYARQMIRYIHLNPVRAGLVEGLEELATWDWCGHGFLLNAPRATGRSFQNREEALRRFGKTENEAIDAYTSYLVEGLEKNRQKAAGSLNFFLGNAMKQSTKGLPAIIGNPEFVRNARERNALRLSNLKAYQTDPDLLKEIADNVCSKYDITQQELLRQGRNNARSKARKDFIIRAHVHHHIPVSAIAQYLHLTLPPVSIILSKHRQTLNERS
ncbi:MAG: hypothetical protein GF398_21530 [Chitinivibrionales bacterium]|nr:hypothetical protein [Chitinivibrionales bacterium]